MHKNNNRNMNPYNIGGYKGKQRTDKINTLNTIIDLKNSNRERVEAARGFNSQPTNFQDGALIAALTNNLGGFNQISVERKVETTSWEEIRDDYHLIANTFGGGRNLFLFM